MATQGHPERPCPGRVKDKNPKNLKHWKQEAGPPSPGGRRRGRLEGVSLFPSDHKISLGNVISQKPPGLRAPRYQSPTLPRFWDLTD